MALVNRSFSVNVTPGMMPPIVHVSEYDVGRAYTVSILDEQGNTFTIPSGTTASIEGTLNGSVGFTQSATISNNQVSFTLSQSMTAYSGKAWCKIKLTQNSQPIQTCAFVLAVDRAGVEAETVIGALGFEEQIQNAVNDYLEDVVIDDSVVAGAVDEWLDNHPEATTTVQDGSLTEAKFSDVLSGTIINTKNGFTNEILADIASGTVGNVTLTEDYKTYDFKGASVGSLTIDCVGATIKNLETSSTVTVKSGSRNCYIEKCKFTNSQQCILFESRTWAFLFDKCTFLGSGSGICMNAVTETNDTLLLNDCYFYGFDKIINCEGGIHLTMKGGWCDSCNYIIFGSGGSVDGGTITIESFDAEEVTAVFKFTSYVFATLTFSGNIAQTSGCICDFSAGAVNLILGCTVSSAYKIFSDTSPLIRYVNTKSMGEMDYPVTHTSYEQTIRLYVPPNSTIEPFGNKIHLFSADCSDSNITFAVNGGAYTKGSTYNGVVNLKVQNSANYTVFADVILKTQNILS